MTLFKPITPSFIIGPLVPLYVAWFFYDKIYLAPWILRVIPSIECCLFPLESEISGTNLPIFLIHFNFLKLILVNLVINEKIQISPSILSANFSKLGDEIKRLEDAGADMVHVDVMDGHFVPNLTIGPPVIKTLKKILQYHLMSI